MRKIVVAINAINPDKNSLEFACYLGRLTNSKITGIFLENIAYEEALKRKPVNEISYSGGYLRHFANGKAEIYSATGPAHRMFK